MPRLDEDIDDLAYAGKWRAFCQSYGLSPDTAVDKLVAQFDRQGESLEQIGNLAASTLAGPSDSALRHQTLETIIDLSKVKVERERI